MLPEIFLPSTFSDTPAHQFAIISHRNSNTFQLPIWVSGDRENTNWRTKRTELDATLVTAILLCHPPTQNTFSSSSVIVAKASNTFRAAELDDSGERQEQRPELDVVSVVTFPSSWLSNTQAHQMTRSWVGNSGAEDKRENERQEEIVISNVLLWQRAKV